MMIPTMMTNAAMMTPPAIIALLRMTPEFWRVVKPTNNKNAAMTKPINESALMIISP